ncbi:MAG: hypothetical protein ACREQQ_12275 [Candidatus Binatia bacterium]
MASLACQPLKPAPTPEGTPGVENPAARSTLPNDPLVEQRRFDDRGGRGGGF